MQSFLERLASAEPTPGGGGAAAAIAAMGAALLSMAARHSLSKSPTEPDRLHLELELRTSEALRKRCFDLVAADALAFDRFMAACRMPRDAAPERERALQLALRGTIEVPLECARAILDGLRLAGTCAAHCHRNVAADAAAGAQALLGALRICVLNVRVNAASLADAAYAGIAGAAADAALREGAPLAAAAESLVLERLGTKGERECSATSKSPRRRH
ncbi:MAG: cyclodeaminase/cyclohydrolase family protein [Gammaproteobacteria bacterium]|nr:cyclodeaminase/cyclohydrolase family protein [Gammaproteobacteria bacterium]